MLNKNLIYKKLPYADQFSSSEEALNYMTKTINSSFQNSSEKIPLSRVDGVQLYQEFSDPGQYISAYFTFNHGLGATPSGFVLIDSSLSPGDAGSSLSIVRQSWTKNEIVVRLIAQRGTAGAVSGSFKILVLR